jgi:hypothetical protein
MKPSNVCVGITDASVLDDPLAGIAPPDPRTLRVPKAGKNGCPTTAQDPGVRVPTGTSGLGIGLGGNYTICPGIYFGGFGAYESQGPKINMLPGIYYMAGGGFEVSGRASITGDGVFIYSAGVGSEFQYNSAPASLDDLVPDCTDAPPACQALTPTFTTSQNPTSLVVNVTYTLRLVAPLGSPNIGGGTVTIYDGNDPIPDCVNLPLSTPSLNVTATCVTAWGTYGTKSLTALYSGDANCAAVATQLSQVVNPPTGHTAADNIVIQTNNVSPPASCNPVCGKVILKAMRTGEYAGLLMFQTRISSVGITLWPARGETDTCPAGYMTNGVGADPNPVPAPCGALGGLVGTIYAPHSRTGAGWDSSIDIRANGVANIQVIAGRIGLRYDTNVRITYRPELFASGAVRLVE